MQREELSPVYRSTSQRVLAGMTTTKRRVPTIQSKGLLIRGTELRVLRHYGLLAGTTVPAHASTKFNCCGGGGSAGSATASADPVARTTPGSPSPCSTIVAAGGSPNETRFRLDPCCLTEAQQRQICYSLVRC